MTRAESVHSSRSAAGDGADERDRQATSSRRRWAARSSGTLLSLPIGESSPVVRLHQVSYALKAHKETGKAVSALG